MSSIQRKVFAALQSDIAKSVREVALEVLGDDSYEAQDLIFDVLADGHIQGQFITIDGGDFWKKKSVRKTGYMAYFDANPRRFRGVQETAFPPMRLQIDRDRFNGISCLGFRSSVFT